MTQLKIIANQVVTKHINGWDPIQLLYLGAPGDEYETEIEQIVDAVLDSKDEIEIAEAIKDIFDRMFDIDIPFDACYPVAKRIWKELFECEVY